MKKLVENKNKIFLIIGLLALSFLISLANPMNPLNSKNFIPVDSSVFAYIGKAMVEYDQVPYRDLFDHKGPFLYFINFIGYLIGELRGIWFLELLSIFISLILIWKISKFFTQNSIASLITIGIISLYFIEFNAGGNFTETYAFPIILGAIYIFNEYLFKLPQNLPKVKILIIGILFGLVLLLRPNMIGVWAGFILVLIFHFIDNKNYQNLFNSIVFFSLGAIIAVLPFILYLCINEAIEPFITYYWSANLKYSDTSFNELFLNIRHFSIAKPIIFISFLFYLYNFINQNKNLYLLNQGYIFSWLFSVPLTAMSGKSYSHYTIVLLPLLIYPLSGIFSKILEEVDFKNLKISVKITTLLSTALMIFILLGSTYIIINNKISPYPSHEEITNYIINNSTDDETIIFIGPGDSLYLSTDRQAASKFLYQKPIADKIPSIITASEFINDLKENEPKFIILYGELMSGLHFDWGVKIYLDELIENGTYQIINQPVFDKNISIYQRK